MDRRLMSRMLVAGLMLGMSGVALAGPAFTIADTEVSGSSSDQYVTVSIGAVGTGEVQGMNLYLGVAAPLEIVGLRLDGPGTLFADNSTEPHLFIYPLQHTPVTQVAAGSVSTARGTVAPNGLPAAIVTIRVPAATPFGRYEVTTELTNEYGYSYDFWSDWTVIPAAAQGHGFITVSEPARYLPEPACGFLLLLGGTVLMQRRSS